MSRPRLQSVLVLPVLTAVVSTPLLAARVVTAPVQDVMADFEAALELWQEDRKAESLDALRRLLASDPSAADVYKAYVDADSEILLDFMSEGDEYSSAAERFLERASLGHHELKNDEDSIRELVSQYMDAQDGAEAVRLINRIESMHGEYAAPRFINIIGDDSNPSRTRQAIVGLVRMGGRSVQPLIATLDSDNETQRGNAVLALQTIGDRRAAGALMALADTDENVTLQGAALRAAEACGAEGSATSELLQLADDYHHRRRTVLPDHAYSDVVWSWGDGGLAAATVPRSIYSDELAKDAYYRVLSVDPSSKDAAAGISRASVNINSKLAALADAGEDVEALSEKAAEGMLSVVSAGPDALDLALQWAVRSGDAATGARLAEQLGAIASAPTEGLRAALAGGGASMAGSAAVALAKVGVRSQSGVGSDVIDALSDAAARRVTKVAVIIDGDAQRANGLVSALEAQNVLGQHAGSGVHGLTMLGQLGRVDAILVGDALPDLETDAVVARIERAPALANTPTFLLTANEDLAEAFGGRVQGSFAGADGLDALQEVFDADLDDSRARADRLSASAAEALALVAESGTGLGAAAGRLAEAIGGRSDAVAVPALRALAAAGDGSVVANIMDVLSSADATDAVRVAAADAVGSIGSRADLPESVGAALNEMLGGDGSFEVRAAAARALGRLKNLGGMRADVLEGVRVLVGASGE